MKNAMQLKDLIKNLAREKHISAQLILQNYMLERFLERLSLSPYRENYIIKGGFLIASMVGLDTRATMDMDATIKCYPVKEDTIRKMIEEILGVFVEDTITFSLNSIHEIRENDDYSGYRVSLSAKYEGMTVPLKLDITSGDKITPKEIEYSYKLMWENRSISVLAYNLSTILAEKLETILSRGDQNTRARDYYDVYVLIKLQEKSIEVNEVRMALNATAEKRGSKYLMSHFQTIMLGVKMSDTMKRQWRNYQKNFDYAKEIQFEDACDTIITLMNKLGD